MSRNRDKLNKAGADVPRASGDEPKPHYTLTTHWSCSPRERG